MNRRSEAAKGVAAIVALGSCAAFGGIPKASPNPTWAAGGSTCGACLAWRWETGCWCATTAAASATGW